MSVYKYKNFRDYLRAVVEDSELFGSKITYAELAKAAGMQRSYLSQVLKGHANLNSDQMYRIWEFLGVEPEVETYLQLLLAIDRCHIPKRKERLIAERDRLIAARQATKHALRQSRYVAYDNSELRAYFCDGFHTLVHMYFAIDRYQNNPGAVREKLQLSEARFLSIISFLERLELIQRCDGKLVATQKFLHLDKDAPESLMHATFFRQQAMQAKVMCSHTSKDLFFTSTIAAAEDKVFELRERLLAAVSWTNENLSAKPPENVYQFNLDLFQA